MGKQGSLFDIEDKELFENAAKLTMVAKIQEKKGVDKLIAKEQKLFNYRVAKIDKLTQQKQQLLNDIDAIRVRYVKELEPVRKKVVEKIKCLIYKLDGYADQKGFSLLEKEKITVLIMEKCYTLNTEYGEPLEDIEKKYNEATTIAEDEKDLMNDMFKSMFGVEIDLGDFEKMTKEELEEKYGEDFDRMKEDMPNKSKKQLAKENQQEEDKKIMETDFGKMYKNLAKKIHPDLEQDEQVKLEKTKLMKELTKARETQDLFKLLSIKTALNKIEGDDSQVIKDDQIKRFNKILLDQIKALDEELFMIKKQHPETSMFYQNFWGRTKKVIDKKIREVVEESKTEGEVLDLLIEDLKSKAAVKRFLKKIEFEDEFENDIFFL